MTSALTPALSPRRGRIIRRVLSHVMFWVAIRLTANDTESVTATRIEKLSSDVRYSPSPPTSLAEREKARLRVSVFNLRFIGG